MSAAEDKLPLLANQSDQSDNDEADSVTEIKKQKRPKINAKSSSASNGHNNPTASASSSTTCTASSPEWSSIAFDKHDFNRNSLSCQGKCLPHGTHGPTWTYFLWLWRIVKRRQLVCLLGAMLLLLMLHLVQLNASTAEDEKTMVRHYSHVPGMKITEDPIGTSSTLRTTSAHANESKNATRKSGADAGDDPTTKLLPPIVVVNETKFMSATSAQPLITFTLSPFYLSNNNSNPPPPSPPNEIATNNIDQLANEQLTICTTNAPPNNATVAATINAANATLPPPDYLVWSDRCKMLNLDPYLPEIMHHFKREKYESCSRMEPLTTVSFNEQSQRYTLQVHEERIKLYSKTGIVDCCYQVIERNATGKNADKLVSLSECISFNKKTKLAETVDNIIVKCLSKKKQVYINGHAMMPERADIRERLKTWYNFDHNATSNGNRSDALKATTRPASVLMIGIDSISRINLIRAMPKTAQYLYDNEWFELSGYNKIDDNTFPNLMAVLIGRNGSRAFQTCPPRKLNGLDDCPFIWKTFRQHGYVTAYGEDESSINTFNYLKLGFEHAPVDYYLRPFLIGAEKHLPVKHKSNLIFCLGQQHSADFVYDYAVELASRYKDSPYFGFFWTNTFSHNSISDPTSMDERMKQYLQKFESLGTLRNTIVVFFSDHGIRFGPTRSTLSGHLEERLPFIFIWIPQYMRQQHPEFINALNVNKNRLTNPYDLHMTLKHVLALSGRIKPIEAPRLLQTAEACPRCQSLLKVVPHNRSCEDVAIEDHWCTCIPYQSIYKKSKTILKLAEATVHYINDFVFSFRNGSFGKLCVPLKLGSVDSAYRAQDMHDLDATAQGSMERYRIVFYTKPNKGLFEATVRYNAVTEVLEVTGEISRLNMYASDSHCVSDGAAKKYCSCKKK